MGSFQSTRTCGLTESELEATLGLVRAEADAIVGEELRGPMSKESGINFEEKVGKLVGDLLAPHGGHVGGRSEVEESRGECSVKIRRVSLFHSRMDDAPAPKRIPR